MLIESLETRWLFSAPEVLIPLAQPLQPGYVPQVVSSSIPEHVPEAPPLVEVPPAVPSSWEKLQNVDWASFVIPPAPEVTKPDLTPVVTWITVGGGSTDDSTRRLGWSVQHGWLSPKSTLFKNVVNPAIEWFEQNDLDSRIVIHNPFGNIPSRSMEFDQAIHAAEGIEGIHPPIPGVLSDFVEAWKPITDGGVEVIAYMGTLRSDSDFVGLSDDAWFERFKESIRLPLEAGMSIALDNSSWATADSNTYKAAELLRSLGVTVYIEAHPPIAHPHWYSFPIIAIESFWQRTQPERHADVRNIYPSRTVFTGGVNRLIVEYITTPRDQVLMNANAILAEGDTVMLQVQWLLRDGVIAHDVNGTLQLYNPQQ